MTRPQPNQPLLHDVFGFVRIAQHSISQRISGWAQRIHQLPHSLRLAGTSALQQLEVSAASEGLKKVGQFQKNGPLSTRHLVAPLHTRVTIAWVTRVSVPAVVHLFAPLFTLFG